MPIQISIEADTPEELSKWVGHLAPLGLPMMVTAPAAVVQAAAPATQAANTAVTTSAVADADEGTDNAEDTRPMRGKNAQAAHDRIIAAIQAAPDEASLRALIMTEQNTMGRLPQAQRSAINNASNARLAGFAPAAAAEAAPAAANTANTASTVSPAAGGTPAAGPKEYVVRDVEGMVMGTLVDPAEAVSLLADISDQQCPGGANVTELLQQNAEMIKSLPDAQRAECREVFAEYLGGQGGAQAGGAQAAAEAPADIPPEVIRDKFQALVEKVAFTQAVAVLKRFEASKISELNTPEKRVGFIAAVDTALAA